MAVVCVVLQEIAVQPASKKSKITPPRSSSGLTPEASTRRALANGATTAIPVSSSAPDDTVTEPSDIFISRLNERSAAEASDQTALLMKKPSTVEVKASADVLPQNSAVVAPALSHSAKV